MTDRSEHITRRVEAVSEIVKNANMDWGKIDKFELKWEEINVAAGDHFEDLQLVPIINVITKK